MDEPWLRDLLDRATASEPPIGPLAINALRVGIKRRRRRRAQGTVACMAAVALIGTAAVTTTRAPASPPAGPRKYTGPSTTYVLSGEGNLYAIPNATKVRSRKTLLPGGRQVMAITPNGKTIYVSGDEPNAVIPFSTATHTVEKPIEFGRQVPQEMVLTPNGKTVYVLPLGGNEIIPIATATNTLEKPIKVGQNLGGPFEMVITPNGKTLYVTWPNLRGKGPAYVVPISTATNTREKAIKIENASFVGLVMNPDGRDVYAIAQLRKGNEIIPIATATNTAGKPLTVDAAGGGSYIAPDGQLLYLVNFSITQTTEVIPFSTATGTLGKPIKIHGFVYDVAFSPDGSTAYVASEPPQKPSATCTGQTGVLTPISTATNLPEHPIRVACDPYELAVTPDGKTLWVGSRNWVTPISTATDKPGKPITFRGGLVAIVIGRTPRPIAMPRT
jgi:DNA-binding beta-propeller fold protein YncE